MLDNLINTSIGAKYHPVTLREALVKYIFDNSDDAQVEKRSAVIAALKKPGIENLSLETAASTLTDFFAVLDKFFIAVLRGTPLAKGKLKLEPSIFKVIPYPLQFTAVNSLDKLRDELVQHSNDMGLRLKVIEKIQALIKTDNFKFDNNVFDQFLAS